MLLLISASPDRIGYITKFCSMIELLQELRTAVFNIEAFRHLVMSQQGKRKPKFSGLLYITKIESLLGYSMRILNYCVV